LSKIHLHKIFYTTLLQYQKRRQKSISNDSNILKSEHEEIDQKIEKIVRLVSESGVTIDTVSQEIKVLEEKRKKIEGQIDNLNKETASLIISEKQLNEMKVHEQIVRDRTDLNKLRQIISYYVKNVFVYYDRIEIEYKFAISGNDNGELIPMTTVEALEKVKEEHRPPRKQKAV